MNMKIGNPIIDDDGTIHQLVRVDLFDLLEAVRRDDDESFPEYDLLHEIAELPGYPFNCTMTLGGMIGHDLIIEYVTAEYDNN